MNEIAISVEKLGKRYVIGRQHSRDDGLRHTLEAMARAPLRWLRGRRSEPPAGQEEFWALQDVSFQAERGEVFGIIGRNGAGKSTLLKLLSRITIPTRGRIHIEGRIASLLEVGTGFHPELTGRENIFLNGAILGMSRAEIRRKFDEIVAFSEVERFLDTPVKRYSSGMYVRLAFAVAAHLEPDILIVDEVLAVGDAQFQKKCLGKMREVSGRSGRTVLFVSHNMGALASLCDRVCWLDAGRVRQVGPTRTVTNEYLTTAGPGGERLLHLGGLPRTAGGDGRLKLTALEWLSEFPLRHGEPVRARLDFEAVGSVDDLALGVGFANLEGTRLLTYDSDFRDGDRPSLSEGGKFSVLLRIDRLAVAPGLYNLDVGSRSGNYHSLDYLPSAVQIEVVPGPATPPTILREGAAVRLESDWSWNLSPSRELEPAEARL